MSINADIYVKMHTGDPGASGGANPATNATRKQVTLHDEVDQDPAVAHSWYMVQSTPISYSTGEVTATESYAWVSFWDDPTGGNHLGNQDIDDQAATLSTALVIPAGTVKVTDRNVIEDVLRAALFSDTVNDRAHRHRHGSFRANEAAAQQDKFAKQAPQTI